jgi:hypothetical protein
MLKTGNKSFTLVEIMAAVCILTLSAVMLYECFFITLDSYSYYSDYLQVNSWMKQKIWDTQDILVHSQGSPQIESNGVLKAGNKNFTWELSVNLLDQKQGLYGIYISLKLPGGKRKLNLSRTAYALHQN